MVKVSTGNDAWDQGLGSLSASIFPDASKIAQAGLYGAQQRKAGIESDILQQEQQGRTEFGNLFTNGFPGSNAGPQPPASPPTGTPGVPAAPNTTGTNGSVPPSDNAGGYHPASVLPGGGGVQHASPAQANGSPAGVDPNVGSYIGQLIAAGTKAGYSPQQIQAGGSALIGKLLAEGRIDKGTAATLSATFGNAILTQAQTQIQQQNIVTGAQREQFYNTPQQVEGPNGPMMSTNAAIARGASGQGPVLRPYNANVDTTMRTPAPYLNTDGTGAGQYTPQQIASMPQGQQAGLRQATPADYVATPTVPQGAPTGTPAGYTQNSRLASSGVSPADQSLQNTYAQPQFYFNKSTGERIQRTPFQMQSAPDRDQWEQIGPKGFDVQPVMRNGRAVDLPQYQVTQGGGAGGGVNFGGNTQTPGGAAPGPTAPSMEHFDAGTYADSQKVGNFTNGATGEVTAARPADIPPGGIAGVRTSTLADGTVEKTATPTGPRFQLGSQAAAQGSTPLLANPDAVGASNVQQLQREWYANHPPAPVAPTGIGDTGGGAAAAPVSQPPPSPSLGTTLTAPQPTAGTSAGQAILAGQAGTIGAPEKWAEEIRSANNLNKVAGAYFVSSGAPFLKDNPARLSAPAQTYIGERAYQMARNNRMLQAHPEQAQRQALDEAVRMGVLTPPDRSQYVFSTRPGQETEGGKTFFTPGFHPEKAAGAPASAAPPGQPAQPSQPSQPAPGPAAPANAPVFANPNPNQYAPGQTVTSQKSGAIYRVSPDGTSMTLIQPGTQAGAPATAAPGQAAAAPVSAPVQPAPVTPSLSSIVVPGSERRAVTGPPMPGGGPAAPYSERARGSGPPAPVTVPMPVNPNSPSGRLRRVYGNAFGSR